MPEWTVEREFDHDGMKVTVKREAISRWPDRIVSTEHHFERVPNSVWLGHCCGQLWMPGFLERASFAASRAADPKSSLNQCDGCARGLPVENGIHRGKGYDLIACTADRYTDKPSA
jgi:hypothetical protein